MSELLNFLQVEQVDTFLFRGESLNLPLRHVFGGQVLSQSLYAAATTVASERRLHSLHAYFLRPGDATIPIIYDVDPIRDGGSFSTRRVVAKQNDKAIFNASLSFQLLEDGVCHQASPMVDAPEPESLETDWDRIQRHLTNYPEDGNSYDFSVTDFDTRSVVPRDPYSNPPAEPMQLCWVRYAGWIDDNPITHQTLLAYISDKELMSTALRPHMSRSMKQNMQLASLDHAMWFHTDFRIDEWLLYYKDSPAAARARGFNRGSFYTRAGDLVASCAQEGLMRWKRRLPVAETL